MHIYICVYSGAVTGSRVCQVTFSILHHTIFSCSLHVYNLTDKSRSTKQDPRKTRHAPENGAEVMPRDSDSDTSGALPGCLRCMSCLCVRALYLPARTWPFFCAFVSVFALADPHVSERVCCACAIPLCLHALHLLLRAFPVPARVLCLVFGRHAQLR